MVSVIVPLYNKKEYIAKTIKSVVAQSFREFELIIVNDGSTDGSEEAATSITDERIIWINQDNKGVSAARNTGVAAANYDWIAFLDADDWWAPSFLDELVHASIANPNHSVFASGRTHVFEDHRMHYKNEFLPSSETTGTVNYFQVISKYLPPINVSNVLIRKSVFLENGGFNPKMHQHEDHDLWMRLAIHNPVILVNKPLSFYNKATKDSQSQRVLEASNFKSYLETILLVKEQISEENRNHVSKYAQRFGCLTFIKFFKSYSKRERKDIYGLLKQILKGHYLWIVQGMIFFPFINYYKLLRRLR